MSAAVRNGQPWTAADDVRIRALAATMNWAELGTVLGRTPRAVQKHAAEIGVARGTDGADWTESDVETLRRIFPVRSSAEVAATLGRTVHAVSFKARALGIRKDPRYLSELAGRGGKATLARSAFHQRRAGRFEGEGCSYTPTQDAARHLQRIAPIWRCDAAGGVDPEGDFWKFSGRVMDAAAVEARAERAGWVRG